jgi:DNA polymerase elongation subunit (family B)
MYQAIYIQQGENYTKTVHLRDDNEGWITKDFRPTYYKIDPNGQYTTLDGKRVSPTNKFEKSNYEIDIPNETRVLIDEYLNEDEPSKWHNIVFLDIECEIGGALIPENIKNSPTKITSIALYDKSTQQTICYILDESKSIESIEEEGKSIITCYTEKELLLKFLDKWEELDPTIVVGWNSEFFDIPYLYFRILRVFDAKTALRLSPLKIIGNLNQYGAITTIESQKMSKDYVDLAGINHLDYFNLFKKYIAKQEPSYKLGDIGKKYVGLDKIKYNVSLDKLFKEDKKKFIEYNIRDVEILIELDKKLQFIDLTLNICHLCHVPYENIYWSTILNEGAILTYLKRQNIVSVNKPTTTNPELKLTIRKEYAGGYLKDPIPGLYSDIIDFDFTSLYPSIIRSLNMGVETLVGNVKIRDKYDSNWTLLDLKALKPSEKITIENPKRQVTQITAGKLIEMVEKNKLMVAASGGLFRSDKRSAVCDVLSDWFDKRVEYKNLMKDAFKKKKDPILGEFYNKRQQAFKIKLNDVYGCFAQNGWRYTDGYKVISNAITLTGQRLIQESIKAMNRIINTEIGTKDVDYVITSDTDSMFIRVGDVVRHRWPDLDVNNRDARIAKILEIAADYQKQINKYLNQHVRDLFNIQDNHCFELKQEVILERGYFAGKRRYAQYIINKEGVTTEELDIKGLDLMKSNFPPLFKEFGENLIKQIMFGKTKKEIDLLISSFKKNIAGREIIEIAKPTGVKKIREYIERGPTGGKIFSDLKLKAPINTKAAIYTNDLLRFKKLDKKYPCFVEGDKMFYVNLKSNPYKIEVIAINGYDDAPEIMEFVERYIDREAVFNNVLLNKLQNLYKDIGWSFPSLNEYANKFFVIS